jgi:hypothetical protein
MVVRLVFAMERRRGDRPACRRILFLTRGLCTKLRLTASGVPFVTSACSSVVRLLPEFRLRRICWLAKIERLCRSFRYHPLISVAKTLNLAARATRNGLFPALLPIPSLTVRGISRTYGDS